MATTNMCDLCGKPAVCIVAVSGGNMTTVSKDLCHEHFILFKKLAQWLTGQTLTSELNNSITALIKKAEPINTKDAD